MRPRRAPISVAVTMNGSEVACNSPAEPSSGDELDGHLDAHPADPLRPHRHPGHDLQDDGSSRTRGTRATTIGAATAMRATTTRLPKDAGGTMLRQAQTRSRYAADRPSRGRGLGFTLPESGRRRRAGRPPAVGGRGRVQRDRRALPPVTAAASRDDGAQPGRRRGGRPGDMARGGPRHRPLRGTVVAAHVAVPHPCQPARSAGVREARRAFASADWLPAVDPSRFGAREGGKTTSPTARTPS